MWFIRVPELEESTTQKSCRGAGSKAKARKLHVRTKMVNKRMLEIAID